MSLTASVPATPIPQYLRLFIEDWVYSSYMLMTWTPLRTIFGIDLRTLALFRILLGTYLLLNVVSRAQDLAAHYTDFGILPRHIQIGLLADGSWSLHLFNGSATAQALLFLLAALAAVALILGWRTRLMTWSWSSGCFLASDRTRPCCIEERHLWESGTVQIVLNTRLRRLAQVMTTWRSAGVRSVRASAVLGLRPLPHPPGVISAR